MRVDAFADRQPNVPLKIGFRISGECPSDHTLLEAFVAQSNSCTVRHDPFDGEISIFSSAPSCETKWSVGDRGAWLDHDRAHGRVWAAQSNTRAGAARSRGDSAMTMLAVSAVVMTVLHVLVIYVLVIYTIAGVATGNFARRRMGYVSKYTDEDCTAAAVMWPIYWACFGVLVAWRRSAGAVRRLRHRGVIPTARVVNGGRS